MTVRIQLRRGSSSEWYFVNPVIADGEIALESDTHKYKVGDGVTRWNQLPYGGTQGVQGLQGLQGLQGIQGIKGINFSIRVDSTTTSNTIYVGKAAPGSSESSEVWTITKFQFSAAGVLLTTTYASGAWSNRTSLTYS